MSVGTIASVSVSQTTAYSNLANGIGGMLHLSSVGSAVLRDIVAVGNEAGTSGGAVAISDSTRTTVILANSTLRRNKAGGDGGGVHLDDSAADIIGVRFDHNIVTGNGGAVATSGTETRVEFSNMECVNVDVLLDWTATGQGCSASLYGIYTCELFTSYMAADCATLALMFDSPSLCSGCPCNLV